MINITTSIHLHTTEQVEAEAMTSHDGHRYARLDFGYNASLYINTKEQLDHLLAELEKVKSHFE